MSEIKNNNQSNSNTTKEEKQNSFLKKPQQSSGFLRNRPMIHVNEGNNLVDIIQDKLRQASLGERDLSSIYLSKLINKNYIDLDLLYREENELKNNGFVEPLLIYKIEDEENVPLNLNSVLSDFSDDSNINKEKYLLVNGFRTFLLAKKLHIEKARISLLKKIPLQNVEEFILISMIKNKEEPLLLARALNEFKNKYHLSTTELSQITELSYSQVLNLIRLLSLNTYCKKALIENKIEYTKVRCLLTLDEDLQQIMLDRIIKENLSTRDIEFEVNKITKHQKNKIKIKREGKTVTLVCPNIQDAKIIIKELKEKYK